MVEHSQIHSSISHQSHIIHHNHNNRNNNNHHHHQMIQAHTNKNKNKKHKNEDNNNLGQHVSIMFPQHSPYGGFLKQGYLPILNRILHYNGKRLHHYGKNIIFNG